MAAASLWRWTRGPRGRGATRRLEKISPAAIELMAQFRNLRVPPQITVVEFGVKLSVDADAFIAAVEMEANFKVTLTWRSYS
jgi:Trypsin-co-occurring domain 1